MRTASFRKAVKGSRVSSSYSLSAPTMGWNARDSIAGMKENEALKMENVFPDTNEVMVRKGWANHVTGLPAQVESLMVYNAPDGTQTMFAAAGTGFYDVTTAGAVGAAVVTGLTNARWQYTNFTNSAGDSYLCCFNGVDAPRYWNGTSWITITDVSTPAITGVTAANIINCTVHKRRMWLVEAGSLKAWYLPVDSVGGAANAIDLGGIAYRGGYLVAMGTWTIDGGEGLDDYWCACTSEGQLVVYKGTDPSSASAWSLVGVWDVGQPLGYRCLYKYKNDLAYFSKEGVFPLSAAVSWGRTDKRVAISDRIGPALTSAAASYQSNYGWEMCYYPLGDMLILNIPVGTNQQEQYAMNTVTGSWGGPFSGVNATCWALFNGEPYFGSDTYVGQFWNSLSDNGSNIDFAIQQAYSYLGTRGRLKQIKAIRPSVLADGRPAILMGISVDFDQNEILGSITFAPSAYGEWDSGLWDGALWGGGLNLYNSWQTVYAIGTAISIRMKGAIQGVNFRYAASDLVYENGGIIG